MFRTSLAAVALLATAAPAAAATYTATGDTTGAPTFNRPVQNGSSAPTSLSGGTYNYRVQGFTVDTAGTYNLNATSTFDNYLVLYSGSFDASQPLANALEADDDDGPGLNALISRSLTAGTSYFAVVTSYTPGVQGAFTLTIDGPGAIQDGTGAVPEPATWGMMILGFGAIGFGMRRRRAKVRTTVAFA